MILYLTEIMGFNFIDSSFFSSISIRAFFSILTSLTLVLTFGYKFIESMKLIQVRGQPIRDDGPESHIIRKKGTPSMGGLLILFSFFFSTLLWADITNVYIGIILLTALLFGFLGFLDDMKKIREQNPKGLSSRQKIAIQILFSMIIIYLISSQSNLEFRYSLSIPFITGTVLVGLLFYYVFTCLVIIGSSNAVNLTDGLDGLAIVPVIITLASFAVISYLSGNDIFSNNMNINYVSSAGEISVLCFSLIGSCLGFLWFNVPPAKIFMGDTGSLSLGSVLGSTAVITKHELLLFIIGGVFVIETISVMIQVISFKLFKKRVFLMAPIHHHFEQKGWSELTIIIRFWFISFVFAIIGLAILKLR